MFTTAATDFTLAPAPFAHVGVLSPKFCECAEDHAHRENDPGGTTTAARGDFDSDSLAGLELPPGYTSLRDRVLNLVREGHPEAAIERLEYALTHADDMRFCAIVNLSLEATTDMKRFGMAEEAARLEDILADYGVEPFPSPESASFAPKNSAITVQVPSLMH
ncbi:MAG: hypothetical protein EOM26_01255 [Alphaproteobacteria bacterium]|nr:hypothetical protein [Alphaproteobacteria bacterium]